MSELPDNAATDADLERWYVMQEQLKKLKDEEVALRRKIFKTFFPTPTEGTNSHSLPDSYLLKADYKIDRKVDEPALNTNTPALRELGVDPDKLVRWKPELAVKEYRKLQGDDTEAGKKRLHLFDQCIIIKPSETPSLEIVLPASAKK